MLKSFGMEDKRNLAKGDELLTPIRVRRYNPMTSRKHPKKRKTDLKKILSEEIVKRDLKLEKIQKRCKGNPLSVKIKYYLLKSNEEGTAKKDLDNLLKIIFDVLSDDMIKNNTDDELKGLGLMTDDEMVYEIHCSKKIVTSKEDMGFDISIFESLNSVEA